MPIEKAEAPADRQRLGVYVDTVYRAESPGRGRVWTNAQIYPFIRFVCRVGEEFDELVLFGREDPGDGGADYLLPTPARLAPLPYYSNLARAREVFHAALGTVRGMWRGLDEVDVVLVFGPYPFSPMLVAFALLRRRRVVLGVRQDTIKYFWNRLPSRLAAPVMVPLWLIDRFYHLLARRKPTVVVGDHLERQYGGPRPGLLALRISLVSVDDVVDGVPDADWSGPIRLLTVGRVEPEKNPLLLVRALAELERREPGRYRLTWVGQGKMDGQVRDLARELGVTHMIDFAGYVPFGPDLLALYRGSHVFVHVAVTEAFGQVITEAMASGTAVVATDVGGVPGAVEGGRAGRLVPPRDSGALVDAIQEVVGEPQPRRARIERGLELARRHSIEAEAARVAALATGAPKPDSDRVASSG